MNTDLMFSSKTDLRATPQDFYDKLDNEFHFTLDPCATHENHKCEKYYTKEEDWLKQSRDNEIVYCNPPYWKEIKKRVQKWSIARGGGRCYALTCKDRHKPISRLYISQIRNQIYKRSFEVRMMQELSTISKYDSYLWWKATAVLGTGYNCVLDKRVQSYHAPPIASCFYSNRCKWRYSIAIRKYN